MSSPFPRVQYISRAGGPAAADNGRALIQRQTYSTVFNCGSLSTNMINLFSDTDSEHERQKVRLKSSSKEEFVAYYLNRARKRAGYLEKSSTVVKTNENSEWSSPAISSVPDLNLLPQLPVQRVLDVSAGSSSERSVSSSSSSSWPRQSTPASSASGASRSSFTSARGPVVQCKQSAPDNHCQQRGEGVHVPSAMFDRVYSTDSEAVTGETRTLPTPAPPVLDLHCYDLLGDEDSEQHMLRFNSYSSKQRNHLKFVWNILLTKGCRPFVVVGRCQMADGECTEAHSADTLRRRLSKYELCPDRGNCTEEDCKFKFHSLGEARAAQVRYDELYGRELEALQWLESTGPFEKAGFPPGMHWYGRDDQNEWRLTVPAEGLVVYFFLH
jgi:hypothetical protein